MSAKDILEAAERAAGTWPAHMPGHVHFGAEALDVAEELPDGVHSAEGSAWQFVVEGGKIIKAVRRDMTAWWSADHTVHPSEPAEGDASKEAGSKAG